MLDIIQGVLESSIPNQGGELTKTFGSGKGAEEEDETDKLKCKARDTEQDENLRVANEVEEKEKTAREAKDTLKTQKTLFPLWTLEQILNEAIDYPNAYSLEPVAFDKIVNAPIPNYDVDQALFSFNLKHIKPQYETWSSKKITVVKVFEPIETESFLNARFKVAHGTASSTLEFNLTDMTYLNPLI
ncbi:unnamed protein product [Lactuca saligna]|uniref:Uncharacterized protein n=1 Tax=Lactuca saligna TaxID=75948 RepID=A0AA36A360_LACSI|nr:unnamed protein product [Lactuca saligna]